MNKDRKSRRDEFDDLLRDAIEKLTPEVRRMVDEVPIIVDDEPWPDLLKEMNLPLSSEPDLCGLHWGIPLNEKSSMSDQPDTPRIHLFRGPIVRLAGSNRRELKRQIQITLIHEIGHLFGLTEERLAELGYE